jgi:hypothetical protein
MIPRKKISTIRAEEYDSRKASLHNTGNHPKSNIKKKKFKESRFKIMGMSDAFSGRIWGGAKFSP